MATTIALDWTVTIKTPDGFCLLDDIEVTAEVTCFMDGDWAVGRFFLEGRKYEGATRTATKPVMFDATNGEPHALWGMIVAELHADEALGAAAFEAAGIRYIGKGSNDPDGRYMEAAE